MTEFKKYLQNKFDLFNKKTGLINNFNIPNLN